MLTELSVMKLIFYIVVTSLVLNCEAQLKFVAGFSYGVSNAAGGSVFKYETPANTTNFLHYFDHGAPHSPVSGVTAGNDDWLYGTLGYDTDFNTAAFYRIRRDGTGFEVLHHLNYSGSATRPYYHTDGRIYYNDENSLRGYDPVAGTTTVLNLDTYTSVRNLYIDADDWIYYKDWINQLIKIKTDGTNYTTLHTFTPATDGGYGLAGVTEVPGDKLFGAEVEGGTNNGGTIYSINKDGSNFTVHHHFISATGTNPESRLVLFDGKLYGTTSNGGDIGYGVIYVINADGSNYRVLASFPSVSLSDMPAGDISISSNGRIFGAFREFIQGTSGSKRMFKVDTSGVDLDFFVDVNQRDNGDATKSILLLPDDETIFYVTSELGRHEGGALSQTDTTGIGGLSLFHFGTSTNGFAPGPLMKASDGRLYGTTRIGGPDGNGTVYTVQPDGKSYLKLHTFVDVEAYQPKGKLLEASDGKLYGVCAWGGTHNGGIIYHLDKNGNNFQVIYDFPDITTGYSPVGGLVEDVSGALYGACIYSGGGMGSVFKINKNGSGYTILKHFNGPTDIGYIQNGLTLSGTYLYGSGYYAATGTYGGVFRIHTDGTGYEVLHTFSVSTDGANPFTSPIVGNDGNLYGTTSFGGTYGYGTIYTMNSNGNNFSVLKHFNTTDGTYSYTGIIQGSDGLLYGISNSSDNGNPLLFRMNLNGSNYTVLKEFDFATEGQQPTSLIELTGFVLPVNLTKFQAEKKDKKVVLSWETSREVNSSSFEIEKSNDGKNFSLIGKIAASGNSNTTRGYSFADDQPKNGANFYRLKQFDKDGRFELSPIRSVVFTKAGSIVVYPNPAADFINLQFESSKKKITIQIFNSEGIMIRSILKKQTELYQIPVRDLPSGNYFIKVFADGEIYNERFAKK